MNGNPRVSGGNLHPCHGTASGGRPGSKKLTVCCPDSRCGCDVEVLCTSKSLAPECFRGFTPRRGLCGSKSQQFFSDSNREQRPFKDQLRRAPKCRGNSHASSPCGWLRRSTAYCATMSADCLSVEAAGSAIEGPLFPVRGSVESPVCKFIETLRAKHTVGMSRSRHDAHSLDASLGRHRLCRAAIIATSLCRSRSRPITSAS